MVDKEPKRIRVEFVRGCIYENLFWNPGGVVDMIATDAEYLIGTEVVKPTKADLTPRPTPLAVPEKETATSVANAIANAITASQPKAPDPKTEDKK